MFQDELKLLQARGLKREDRLVKDVVNLSSNDYLGLSNHPIVIEKAKSVIQKLGVGGTSSRLLAGTQEIHQQLETSLAQFIGKEAALIFSSGYHMNTGVIPVIAEQGDFILLDELSHASIIDGVRLSHARFSTFRHNDMAHLSELLERKRSKYRRVWIITEGIFSMDGDPPPLKSIVKLAKKWNALTYIDEAHSFGLFGKEGRGLTQSLGLTPDVDVIVGTLSKTLGSQGGFVTGSASLRDVLVSRSRSFIYTTALAPACVAGAQAALDLLPTLNDRRKKVSDAAQYFRTQLLKSSFNTMQSQSQIIPVWTGEVHATKKLSDYLLSCGFFVPSIRPPTVPVGEGRVRLSMTFDVANENIESLVDAFDKFKEKPDREKAVIV